MRRLSPRECFDLQDHWQRQQDANAQRNRIRNKAETTVGSMFDPRRVSPGVAGSLVGAVSAIERCREADTDADGIVNPQPITLPITRSGNVHETITMPVRSYGFQVVLGNEE